MAQSHQAQNTETMARSSGIPPRLRNEGTISPRIPVDSLLNIQESWVDIASQPSSSSLSSIGDDIVTTGLRVQTDPNVRRRRRVQGMQQANLQPRQNTSSQEEYEESESEEDQVMTSSNEHVIPIPPTVSHPEYDAGSDSDDDDENATALGRRTDAGEPTFTPQPNAFSHPPAHRSSLPGSYFPPHASSGARPPYPSRNASRQHSSYNPQADHDAALRASLTTLLSIGAAAARGLPKRNQPTNTMSNEPMGLRFVPESELIAPTIPANTSRPMSPSTRARSSPSISSQEAVEKGKRKAAASKPGEKPRALKKKRMQAVEEEAMISPTLLTWVVSAGVVVLVSVVGFGAGYVIGREVGRQEVLGGLNGSTIIDGGSCGREVARSTGSLRRFKWGIGGAAKAIVA
ncbi:hypothetical protein L207DRAFT_554127 [Hyaloscypha variabilis F]|uniref:Uncharacterized protein n=1 Tax=Hyaloscypha variabilis (strain UAMH 11265 / GT02V1 / F) TaxID=1149755 RepID=A0A2J6RTU3_HYAVF|nr:hypothetical protein L207DRAFT_554127 [Hyaloscypha variabilis F]